MSSFSIYLKSIKENKPEIKEMQNWSSHKFLLKIFLYIYFFVRDLVTKKDNGINSWFTPFLLLSCLNRWF